MVYKSREKCLLLLTNLRLEDLEGSRQWLLLRDTGVRGGLRTNVHVSLQEPSIWQTERLPHSLVDTREAVHVLEVGTETLELDGSPDLVLEHAVAVLSPLVEHVRRGSVCILRCLDICRVVPERDLYIMR